LARSTTSTRPRTSRPSSRRARSAWPSRPVARAACSVPSSRPMWPTPSPQPSWARSTSARCTSRPRSSRSVCTRRPSVCTTTSPPSSRCRSSPRSELASRPVLSLSWVPEPVEGRPAPLGERGVLHLSHVGGREPACSMFGPMTAEQLPLPSPRTQPLRGGPALQWGVVAPGTIAADFVHALHTHTDQRVTAVASRSAERSAEFARRFEIPRSYGDYGRLYGDPDVQIVYVAS